MAPARCGRDVMLIRVHALCVWLGCCVASAAWAATERPHVLLLVADDLGWNDVGYHGSRIETPNIDRIAGLGIELDRFYAQPTCSPTRAALLTGKSPTRLRIYRPIDKNSERSVPLTEHLLPQYLNALGYQSFAVGKWHLGHHARAQLPNQRGFAHFYGSLTGGVGYWNKVHGGGYDWQRDGETLRQEGYVTHLLARETRRARRSCTWHSRPRTCSTKHPPRRSQDTGTSSRATRCGRSTRPWSKNSITPSARSSTRIAQPACWTTRWSCS